MLWQSATTCCGASGPLQVHRALKIVLIEYFCFFLASPWLTDSTCDRPKTAHNRGIPTVGEEDVRVTSLHARSCFAERRVGISSLTFESTVVSTLEVWTCGKACDDKSCCFFACEPPLHPPPRTQSFKLFFSSYLNSIFISRVVRTLRSMRLSIKYTHALP